MYRVDYCRLAVPPWGINHPITPLDLALVLLVLVALPHSADANLTANACGI